MRYKLDRKVCMDVPDYLWCSGCGSVYRLGLGLGPGNGFYSFFFPALKSDEHLMRC